MRIEVPVCKRCCFCLPLRYGLITWGYFRLKNLNFLRAYYIYSFILCTLTGLMGVAFTMYFLFFFDDGFISLVINVWLFATDLTVLWGQIFIQIYMVLLVRSEIVKLRSNCEFRFVNNATDAECVLRCKVEGDGEEGTE